MAGRPASGDRRRSRSAEPERIARIANMGGNRGEKGGGHNGAGMRVFRRRRRRTGPLLASLLSLVILGALALPGMGLTTPGADPGGTTSTAADPVARVETPNLSGTPDVAEDENSGGSATSKQRSGGAFAPAKNGDSGDRQPERAATRPAIPQPATNDLWMTIPKMELYDNYVANDDSTAAMDQGAIKLPSTGFPWQEGSNTYIAAHRLGWPGTASYYQFYDLPNLALGDKIYLGDANGTTYTYEVIGFKEVLPSETWVTAPKAGRDMVSLQTCIEDYGDYWTMGPNWYVRYVVQADRVSVDPAG